MRSHGGKSRGVEMKSRGSNVVSPADGNPTPEAAPQDSSFPIVAIGASAGGLDAYTEFFKALPHDLGMAFVVVQHLDPSHHSLLANIISKATTMPVEEVKSGVGIKPNCVFVIPTGVVMAISRGVFTLTPRSKEPGQHLAINLFMRSLAEDRKSRAIGIVLSGTGNDGTLGLADIKAEGGITFAQGPDSSKYDGMPRSAIASGCVDFVLPPKGIAKELERITRHPYVMQEQDEEAVVEAPPLLKKDFNRVMDQLGKVSGIDFSQYKPSTLHRRTLRRMVILKLDSMSEYAEYLKEHREETEKLFDDVLIPVTSFFRDLEAFEALRSQVYPAIVRDKANRGAIRMWAPGCSTGEETYSLAMTLLEFLGDKAASYQIQIFGTDVNEKGVHKARAGVYGESIADEVSPERLQRFFIRVDEGYQVNKAVRDMCIFAQQNLASDPPFSQMNVVACRNLLIYMEQALQRRIVPILHYALKPSGFLVLGRSEGVSGFSNLFSTLDAKHRIYAKLPVASRLHYDFSQTRYPAGSAAESPGRVREIQRGPGPEFNPQEEADRVVLQNFAPVGVVINGALEVIQFRGRTSPYLEPPPGKPSLNVLKLARNGLALELRSLINAARKKNTPVRKNDFGFDLNGQKRVVNLSVSPLGEKHSSQGQRCFLILFEDITPLRISGSGEGLQREKKASTGNTQEFKRLKQELADAQDALRAAVESEEAAKEEFQSANEEILSANEELQSTNEELETSKEELQSANEELNTLNAELRHKNTELHDLNNDLTNLLNSTRLPVVMLDSRLRIRRLTSNADKLLKVVPGDVGRSISDIKLNLQMSDLEPAIARVLNNFQPVEREVQDLERHWYSLHILPYKTLDNKIDGVVLVLQDINPIREANEQLRKSTEFFQGIIRTVREPLVVLDATLRIVAVNDSFVKTFRTTSEQTVNRFLYRIADEQWNITRLRVLLEEVLPKQQAVTDFQVDQEFENIGHRTMLLNARTLFQSGAQEHMILLAIEDITERQRVAEELRQSHAELQSQAEELSRFNRSAVGRELRMIELKKEINELCRLQGEPVRYRLETEDDGKEPHGETSETGKE